MKTKLLAAAFAATLLPSCSNAADPFEGRPAEEVVTYILFGLEDKAIVKNREFALEVSAMQPKPYALGVTAVQGDKRKLGMISIVNRVDDCTYMVDFDNRNPSASNPGGTFKIDLTNLTAAKLEKSEFAVFEGASIECVKSKAAGFCEFLNTDEDGLRTGKWQWRVGPFDKDKNLEADQTKVNAAITHFKANICKPKS